MNNKQIERFFWCVLVVATYATGHGLGQRASDRWWQKHISTWTNIPIGAATQDSFTGDTQINWRGTTVENRGESDVNISTPVQMLTLGVDTACKVETSDDKLWSIYCYHSPGTKAMK